MKQNFLSSNQFVAEEISGATTHVTDARMAWRMRQSCCFHNLHSGQEIGVVEPNCRIVLGGQGVVPSRKPNRSYPNRRLVNQALQDAQFILLSLNAICVVALMEMRVFSCEERLFPVVRTIGFVEDEENSSAMIHNCEQREERKKNGNDDEDCWRCCAKLAYSKQGSDTMLGLQRIEK